MGKRVSRLIEALILALFMVILCWLTAVAGTSTAQITLQGAEHTFLVSDSLWMNMLCAAIFLLLLVLYRRNGSRRQKMNQSIQRQQHREKAFLLIIGIGLFLLVILTQKIPREEQANIMECAEAWRAGDYSSITQPGAYLDRYANQRGIVLIIYLLSFVLGTQNLLAFQFMNVLCLVWFYSIIIRLYHQVCEKNDEDTSDVVLKFFILAFIPLFFYVNFIYGTLIGLALSMAALEQLNKLLTSFRWKNVFCAWLLLFAAITIKQNYLIFALGSLLGLGIYMIRESQWKLAIPCVGIILVMLLSSTIINSAMSLVTGVSFRKEGGVSALSYVSMGLQENDQLYDGWWNHYNTDTYYENECSREKQNEIVKVRLGEQYEEFKRNPGYFIRFLAGKNASQWNNPNFQGFWINQVLPESNGNFRSPYWIDMIFGLNGTRLFTKMLDRLQFIILLGAVLSILCQNQRNFVSISVILIFLGGFVFHTFWEAKSEYTLPYFALLLPLSARGWTGTVRWFSASRKDWQAAWRIPQMKRGLIIFALLTGLMLTAQTGKIPVLNATVRRIEDTGSYQEYLKGMMEGVETGDL